MKTELAKAEPTQKRSVISALAARYEVEPNALLSTLRESVFKGANDAEMMAFAVVANEYDLNPFTKQIYAIRSKGGGITPVVSIDGWIKLANDHPQYDGVSYEFEGSIAFDKNGKPLPHESTLACHLFIYRRDRSHPIKATELLSERYRNTEPWNQNSHTMLKHKAFKEAARYAFGFSFADPEDAARIEEPVVSSTVTISPPSRGSSDLPFHAPDAIEPDPSPSESASVGGSFTLEAEPDAFPADAPPAVQYRYLTEKAVIHDEEIIDALRRLKVIDGRTKALKADHVALVVAKWDDVKEAVKANRAEALTGEGAE